MFIVCWLYVLCDILNTCSVDTGSFIKVPESVYDVHWRDFIFGVADVNGSVGGGVGGWFNLHCSFLPCHPPFVAENNGYYSY